MPLSMKPNMLNHQTCKNILNEGNVKYSDEEVKKISELIFFFAELTLRTYNDLEEQNN
jgi:hypothetical protein